MEPPSYNRTDCLDEKYPSYRYVSDVFFVFYFTSVLILSLTIHLSIVIIYTGLFSALWHLFCFTLYIT